MKHIEMDTETCVIIRLLKLCPCGYNSSSAMHAENIKYISTFDLLSVPNTPVRNTKLWQLSTYLKNPKVHAPMYGSSIKI